MSFRYEIRLSGAGGQGLILVGKILAEAAAIYDEKNATQSQSYGPEARGGASRSEVIISDDEAVEKYAKDVKENGIVIVDSSFVKQNPDGNFKVYSYPITNYAEDEIGKKIVANIIALGAIVKLSGIISENAVINAIRARVPKGTEDLNIKAFKFGIELVSKA